MYPACKFSLVICLWTWISADRASVQWDLSTPREFYYFSLKYPMDHCGSVSSWTKIFEICSVALIQSMLSGVRTTLKIKQVCCLNVVLCSSSGQVWGEVSRFKAMEACREWWGLAASTGGKSEFLRLNGSLPTTKHRFILWALLNIRKPTSSHPPSNELN